MEMIPDAPYIREAEMNGMPSPEKVYCPCCGRECLTIYAIGGDVIGCEQCVDVLDANEWLEQKRIDDRPDWADK